MFSPLSHLRPPLPRSLYNMCARWERGVSAQAKWVRENEAGMSPSPQKKDDPQSEKTHPRTERRASLFLMGMPGQICTVEPCTCAPSAGFASCCGRFGGGGVGWPRPCQGRKMLSEKAKSLIKNSSTYFSLAGLVVKNINASAEFQCSFVLFFMICSQSAPPSNVFRSILLIIFCFSSLAAFW